MFSDTTTLMSYLDMGGFVMPPLILVAILLWYALVFRLMNIKTSSRNPRKLIKKARKGKLSSKAITARATLMAVEVVSKVKSRDEFKSRLNESFYQLRSEMNKHRALVRSLVMVAPLLASR